jgi:isoquinoline 1-oxidoreductase beta subunit
MSLPAHVKLKEPAAFKLMGQPTRRVDTPAKIDGSAQFGIDARPAGLVHAAVRMSPVLGGTVATWDGAAAQRLPGVVKVVRLDAHHGGSGGVAVIADTTWHAMKAVEQVAVSWNDGAMAAWSSADIFKSLTTALDQEQGFAFYSSGDVDAAMKTAARRISADYRAPLLAHANMETMNCTVWFRDGAATVWVGTQVPGLARSAVAKVLGIAADKVDLRVTYLGGGFGRRLEVDFIAQAAQIARDAGGAPVQVLWSREQDMAHDFYRPPCVSRFEAGLDAKGQVVAWRNLSAGPAILPQVLARTFGLPGAGPDKTASEGAFDQPYEWPAARIAHQAVDLPLQVGFWRSVGHSHQAFFKESFVDEAAAAAGADPVAYRAALLAQHPRHLAVLMRAASAAGWGQPLAAADDGAKKARGVALHQSFGSIVAQVAEVSIGPEKRIRVHRIVCAVDCGFVVNPDGVRAQIDSAVVYGLSAALDGAVTVLNGRVVQSNFHDQPALRMGECPQIETELIASGEPPEGMGEPGLPPVAPAVANAVFALTGQRLRELPLKLA